MGNNCCGNKPLMIDDGCRMLRFYPEKYCLVRANGNYCDVFGDGMRAKPTCTLSYKIGRLHEVLCKWGYVRINRSELVNTEYVMQIYGNTLTLQDGCELRITASYRDELVAQFDVLTEKREKLE